MKPDPPDFEVVVPVYRGRDKLVEFLDHVGPNTPTVVVDNSSAEDDLSGLVSQYPRSRYIDAGGNLGFSVAANLGASSATANYLVIMNPDTRPTEVALRELVGYLEAHPDVASCGAAGVDTTGGGAQPTFWRLLIHSLGLHLLLRRSGVFVSVRRGETLNVGWVSGSCMAIRRDAFEAVGGFDPAFFIYMSDFDLGKRLGDRGMRQVLLGDVVVPHDDGGSSDIPSVVTWERRGRAWVRFFRHWRSPPVALALSTVQVLALVSRTVLYGVTRQKRRAREMWTYSRAIVAEWIRPEIGLEERLPRK